MPPAWASLAPDEVLEHEDFSPLLEGRAAEARQSGKDETYAQMQPFLRRQEAQSGQVVDGLRGINEALKRAQRDSTITPEQLGDLMTDHEKTFETLRGLDANRGFWSGVNELVGALSQAGKTPEVVTAFQNRVWEFSTADKANGNPDPQLWGDLLKAFTKGATEPLKADLAEAKATVKRLEAEAKQTKTNSQPAPTTVAGAGGGGGGKSDTELKADPNTPIDVLKKIRDRERGLTV